MKNTQIRKAISSDLENILNIYEYARSYMKKNGNSTQWGLSYPSRDLLEDDIRKEQLYVITTDDTLHGVFAFIVGEDPTYKYIENGQWLSNEQYGTIHRIAGDGAIKGMFSIALEYCSSIIPHMRLDTHKDNKTMQHLALKNGFKECGTIYVGDGSSRIAYEKIV